MRDLVLEKINQQFLIVSRFYNVNRARIQNISHIKIVFELTIYPYILLDFFGNWAHEMYFILYSTCRCSRNHNFASIAHSYFTLLHEKPCRNDTSLFFRYYTKVHFLLDFTVFIKSLYVFLKQKIMVRQKIIHVFFILYLTGNPSMLMWIPTKHG